MASGCVRPWPHPRALVEYLHEKLDKGPSAVDRAYSFFALITHDVDVLPTVSATPHSLRNREEREFAGWRERLRRVRPSAATAAECAVGGACVHVLQNSCVHDLSPFC